MRSIGACHSGEPAMDQEARGGVSGAHHGSVLAALEDVPVGCERQAAFALVLAVTLEAALREDRLDLLLEINARGRRRLTLLRQERPTPCAHRDRGEHAEPILEHA
jgi:hypothetical protein